MLDVARQLQQGRLTHRAGHQTPRGQVECRRPRRYRRVCRLGGAVAALGRDEQVTGTAEPIPLPQRRTVGQGLLQMLVGLDAFSQDRGAAAFVVGNHRGDGAGLQSIGLILHQLHVQLEDVGGDQVQQSQRIAVHPDVVERDRVAGGTQGGNLAQQCARIGQQLTFGQLEDQMACLGRGGHLRCSARVQSCGGRLDVDQQQHARGRAALHRRLRRLTYAVVVQRVERSVGPCPGEHVERTDIP